MTKVTPGYIKALETKKLIEDKGGRCAIEYDTTVGWRVSAIFYDPHPSYMEAA